MVAPTETAAAKTGGQIRSPEKKQKHWVTKKSMMHRSTLETKLTFKSGNKWITPDIDGHTGYQTWKVFDSSGNRLGTYNTDLTVRLGK